MSKLKYELDEGLSPEEAELQQLALDQLKKEDEERQKLQQLALDQRKKEDEERKAKDNADLTDEGALIWIDIKKREGLEWHGKYCLPTTGTWEEKSQKLEDLLRKMNLGDYSQVSGQDRRVVWERVDRAEKWCRNPPKRATDEDETPAGESKPIPEDATLKIQTECPLDKLVNMFAAMVQQGWVAQGAERLVLLRFTNSALKEPVPPDTPMFDWRDASAKLRRLRQDLDWPNARMPDHFLLKGKSLNPETLRTGGKTTDDKHFAAVRELTKIYLP